MALTLNTTCRNAILDSGLNTAFNGGKFRIYDGTKPATANLAPTGTLLVEVTAADFFAAAASGSISLNAAMTDSSANATGTAGWFRFSASGDTDLLDAAYARIDGTVTASGGGGDITLDNTSITSGQSVSVSTFSFTMPAS